AAQTPQNRSFMFAHLHTCVQRALAAGGADFQTIFHSHESRRCALTGAKQPRRTRISAASNAFFRSRVGLGPRAQMSRWVRVSSVQKFIIQSSSRSAGEACRSGCWGGGEWPMRLIRVATVPVHSLDVV